MLQILRIKNYALIDDATIIFEGGFTTITGETGAGKSIMLGALSLLLGNRADTSVLRDSTVKSVVEANFDIQGYNLEALFDEYDVDYETDTVIRREITPAGKSRSFVNDTPVNLAFLKSLGENLIEIHSQNSNLSMRDPLFQLEVVDLLANNSSLLANYRDQFSEYKALKKELESLKSSASTRKAEADFKQFQYDELDSAKLVEGELSELENEYGLQSNLEEVKGAIEQAVSAITVDDTGCQALLSPVLKSMQDAGKYNDKVLGKAERLSSVLIELSDLGSDLESMNADFEYDPERVEFLRNRIDVYNNLFQKHKVSTEKELIDLHASLNEELQITNDLDAAISNAGKAVENSKSLLEKQAKELRSKRLEIIPEIEKNIVILLRNLGMPNAQLTIDVSEAKEYSLTGADDITFLLSANKNSPAQPVHETASGGEVSRIMLCIKSLLSKSKQLPSIVFDEIDIGVSGDIAEKMAFIMREMSAEMQVITITHLPQIASKGAQHYAVSKQDTEHATITRFALLNEDERVEEIAKMLSGKELTEAALQNASHLLRS